MSEEQNRSAQFTVRCIYGSIPANVERIHQYNVGGESFDVSLYSNKPVSLPEEFARQFLQDGFEVCDESGMILRGPSRGRQSSVLVEGEALQIDETIARLDELTVVALVARANLMPSGEKFKKGAKKDTVVNFLLHAAEAKAAEVAENAGVAEDDMSDDEAAGMLPDAATAVNRAMAGG